MNSRPQPHVQAQLETELARQLERLASFQAYGVNPRDTLTPGQWASFDQVRHETRRAWVNLFTYTGKAPRLGEKPPAPQQAKKQTKQTRPQAKSPAPQQAQPRAALSSGEVDKIMQELGY